MRSGLDLYLELLKLHRALLRLCATAGNAEARRDLAATEEQIEQVRAEMVARGIEELNNELENW